MDNVKTFFKTLLWTLVVLIVLIGGFWAYMRFFNQDLAKSFTELVYKSEAIKCEVCEECEVCGETTSGDKATTDTANVDFDKEFGRINDKLNDALDMLDELDNVDSMNEYGVVEEPKTDVKAETEMTKDEIIEDLMKRIEKLEDK